MTPQTFIAKWGAPDGVPGPAFALNEEQGAQSHFLDLSNQLALLRRIWTAARSFKPKQTSCDITEPLEPAPRLAGAGATRAGCHRGQRLRLGTGTMLCDQLNLECS